MKDCLSAIVIVVVIFGTVFWLPLHGDILFPIGEALGQHPWPERHAGDEKYPPIFTSWGKIESLFGEPMPKQWLDQKRRSLTIKRVWVDGEIIYIRHQNKSRAGFMWHDKNEYYELSMLVNGQTITEIFKDEYGTRYEFLEVKTGRRVR